MYNRLQYISQGNTASEQVHNVQRALAAGCRWIQLRFKNADAALRASTAREVQALCQPYQAQLIINDHPQLAAEIGADGLHLGLDDMPVAEARAMVGASTILGGTANTLDHVLQRVDEGCDYVGLGPFRFTSTKEKLSPILGVEGYADIMNALSQRNIRMPVYAIGGILPEDISHILQTGVHGIAVSGVITHHADPAALVEHLNTLLHGNATHR